MSDISKASPAKATKAKSSVNWPVWIAAGLLVVFVVGVWVNNYRVSHAAAAAAAIAAKK
jgi:sensor domain CHASE-containing protein